MSDNKTVNETKSSTVWLQNIISALDWVQRELALTARQFLTARAEGNRLAAEVARYLDDPTGEGTDALASARYRWLQHDAGNFVSPQ